MNRCKAVFGIDHCKPLKSQEKCALHEKIFFTSMKFFLDFWKNSLLKFEKTGRDNPWVR